MARHEFASDSEPRRIKNKDPTDEPSAPLSDSEVRPKRGHGHPGASWRSDQPPFRTHHVQYGPRASRDFTVSSVPSSSVPSMTPQQDPIHRRRTSHQRKTLSPRCIHEETVSGGTSESADGTVRKCAADNSTVASRCPSHCRQTRGRAHTL